MDQHIRNTNSVPLHSDHQNLKLNYIFLNIYNTQITHQVFNLYKSKYLYYKTFYTLG